MSSEHSQYSIRDLAQFMKKAKEDGQPYVFLTGAGCSYTAGIPLANEIVKELNEKFELELKLLNDDDRKDYGKCMELIEVSKRREYLKKYIDNAKINWAHIALASLLEAGYIRRILTFNFDNLLARSCGLLGLYPATYDFTAANLNLHNLIDDPAIVHLHGQGHGFVQLNTSSETSEHAEQLKDFIRHTLNESPTLFIGYSGQNDAFLPQIEAEFSEQKRLFWVDMSNEAPKHLQQSLLKSNLANYMSCNNGGADTFLIELAQQLDCFPPVIFSDPYQHLLNEMNEVADYPISKEKVQKDEALGVTKTTVDTEDILLEKKFQLKEAQTYHKEKYAYNFEEVYLKGDYQDIVDKLECKKELQQGELLWLARSYLSLAVEQTDPKEEVEWYDKLINKFLNNKDLKLETVVARALFNKGIALGELKQFEQAIAVYDDIVERYGASDALELKEIVADALVNKGVRLDELKLSEQAIAVFDDIVERYGASDALVLQESVARALFNKGGALNELKLSEQAIAVFDDIVEHYGASEALGLQELIANALVNKGVTLGELNQSEQEFAVYEDVVERYGTSDALVLREAVAKALFNKGGALVDIKQSEQAIAVFDDIVERYGTSDELGLQEQVAKALFNKGVVLGELKQSEQAIAVYDEIVERYGVSDSLVLEESVAKALFNKGVVLGELKQSDQAIAVYNDIIERYGASDALGLQEQVAKALFTKGIIT